MIRCPRGSGGYRERNMMRREQAVKRYVVRLRGEERERLEALLGKGKSPAQRLLKARISHGQALD